MLVFPVIGWFLFVKGGDWGWFEVAILLCFSAVVQVITYAHRTALRAVGEARLEAFVRIADRGTVAILMVGFASGELLGFAVATAVGPLVALALALYLYLSKVAPQASDSGDEPPDTAEMGSQQLVGAGLPFLFASAALVVNVRIEKLLLGVFATPTDVAEFQIAWLGFIAGYGPILSLRAILLSWFGEVRNDIEKLKHRYKRALFACTLLSCVGAIIGVGVGPFAFEALFPDYAESVQRPFLALMLAWLFHSMASPSLALIQVGDRPWNYTRILWTGIAVSSVACLYLIPTQPSAVMGAAGAAALASLVVLALAFAVAGRGGSAATEETDVTEQQPGE
jgi:O-antigen/teichoic acid export membrane protein